MSKWSIACVALLLSVGCAKNEGAQCSPACASLQTCCDGVCVFTQTDRSHCGVCGAVCNGTCNSGVCVGGPGMDASTGDDGGQGNCHPVCAASQSCCGTTCVGREQPLNMDGRPSVPDDPSSAFNNCNGCGVQCDPERASSCSVRGGGTAPECACGEFAQCPAGELCVPNGATFHCISTSTDPNNCGEIGNACAEGETCSGGVCACGGGAACAAGQACCGGACIDTSTDAMNCGGCGMVCPSNAPDCQASACTCAAAGHACTAPMGGLLGSDPGESCCAGGCVANGEDSSGVVKCGCGVMCESDETCIVDMGFLGMGGTGEICCGQGFGPIAMCTGGGGGDGGPGLPDAGAPDAGADAGAADAGADAGAADAGAADAGAFDGGP